MIEANASAVFHDRVARFRALFGRRDSGDLLFVCNYLPPGFRLEGLETSFELRGLVDQAAAYGRDVVRQCRARFAARLAVNDDSVPFVNVGLNVGAMTSIFSGAPVTFEGGTTWSAPVLADIEDLGGLTLDLDGPWLRRVLAANRAALAMYDDDFCITPLFFRSPLDLANGLRGDLLFTDLHDRPESVDRLLDWCTASSIRVWRHLEEHLAVPPGRWGMWRTWLPDRIVPLNADPIDLISGSMSARFDRRHSESLMRAAAGGGFYHHHGVGAHQIGYVAGLEGLTMQNIVADPGGPDLMLRLVEDRALCEAVLAASLRRPIHWKFDNGPALLASLDALRHGRFVFDLYRTDDLALCRELAGRVRRASGLH